ncbi:unnamed protein product, partial [Musa banksii]
MNWSSSGEAYVLSTSSFAGLEGSSRKRHLWDCEASSHHHDTNHTFFPNTPIPDCPPPLLPMNNLPFCWPPPTVPKNAVEPVPGGQIGLNLWGHRTYFPPGDGLETAHLFALRSVGAHSPSHTPPRCQADGCSADLSGPKYYHRRHKVCEFHFKAAVVVAHGLHQRFCQQCSRFHVLAEFDEAKRSCRKKLADHNRRRRRRKRKSQLPTTIPKVPQSTPSKSSVIMQT